MNKHLYEFENHSSTDNDPSTSDRIFNSLFSEFDVNINDIEFLDNTTTQEYVSNSTTSQLTEENQSANIHQSLTEQYQQQISTDTNLSTSYSDSNPTEYQQLLTINPSNQLQFSNEHTTDSSSSSSSTTHPLNQTKPITITFDQLQSLASTQTSNALSILLENSTIIGHNIPLKIVSSKPTEQSTDKHVNKIRRKPSHNVIEKRYRSSINERIHELKQIVSADDEKLQKSGILQRTIEYIRRLQSKNQRLEEENSTLKIILKQLNLTNDEVQSTSRNSSTSSFSNTDGESSSKKEKTTKPGMGNGSRLSLCCFMLCIILTNPFSYLLNQLDSSESIEVQSVFHSRTLQSTIDNEYLNLSSKQIIGWMMNIALCLLCLVKIFVHGDIVLQQSDIDEYYSLKKKADQYSHQNRLNEAYFYYKKSCEKLSIEIDRNSFSTMISILWQLCRLILNIIYIGQWLSSWSAWMRSSDGFHLNFELNSCYFQLWKIEYQFKKSILNRFHLLILTINTTINSEKKFNDIQRYEIYFLSILTMKTCSRWISFGIVYFIRKILRIEDNQLTDFLFEKSLNSFENSSLIESIRFQYSQYILYENIRYQLIHQNSYENYSLIINDELVNEFSWWIYCLHMIQGIASNRFDRKENIFYEQIRRKKYVDQRYITIMENLHLILYQLNQDTEQIERLDETSRLLISMIKFNCEKKCDLAIKTLFLDGILSLRLRLLTNLIMKNPQQKIFLDDFQQEICVYKHLNQLMKLPKQRIYLFESIFRILSGLNPLTSETLFECAIKQRKQEFSSNFDIISALLLFGHYSPSTINRYQNILQQTAMHISKTTNSNVHLNRLKQHCLQSYLTL